MESTNKKHCFLYTSQYTSENILLKNHNWAVCFSCYGQLLYPILYFLDFPSSTELWAKSLLILNSNLFKMPGAASHIVGRYDRAHTEYARY